MTILTNDNTILTNHIAGSQEGGAVPASEVQTAGRARACAGGEEEENTE